jgi:hypothetical protein
MKKLTLEILYKLWSYLASRNKYPQLCEKVNLWINELESK